MQRKISEKSGAGTETAPYIKTRFLMQGGISVCRRKAFLVL